MYLLYFEVVFWEDGKSVTKTASVISLKAELQNTSFPVTTVTKTSPLYFVQTTMQSALNFF